MFSVPFEDGTYALGVVARRDRGGDVALAYFFGPRRRERPHGVPGEDLRPADAVLVRRVSPHGFDDGSCWFWRERYDDDDPGELLGFEPASDDDVETLPEQALYGDRARGRPRRRAFGRQGVTSIS